ncbi:MAG: Na/Pi cotransporter family protein [Opitutaceae bacterium]|nr:Na/Pi cotransporter family protein [Opitutaceae bacterium]
MTLLQIAGGVALILFGVRFLRKGLERMLSHRLYDWLEHQASHPARAALAGAAFGAIAPSSTAQVLIALQLLRTGKIPPAASLGFLLGANLGTTVTVQLIALRLYDYYPVLLVAGLLLFQATRRELLRGIGQAVLGMGFIFLGMEIIGTAAAALAGNPDFTTVLGVLTHYRTLVLLFAAGATFALQSSTATIGLALAVAGAGPGLQLVLPVVLGANLGTGLTALAAGFGTLEGRRLAAATVLVKGAGLLLALPALDALEAWLAGMPGSLARHGANFHTCFNLATTAAGVALARPVERLLRLTLRPVPAGPGGPDTHLDPDALRSPPFALANAARETLREADAVKQMLAGAWQAVQARDPQLAAAVQRQDDRIDELNAAIKAYLSQIPPGALSPRDQQIRFGLLNFSSQLESIGDIVDKSLCGAVRDHAEERLPLAPGDQEALDELYRRVLRRLDAAIGVLAARDAALARQFLAEGDALKEWCLGVQQRHFANLAPDDPRALAASTRFLDTFNVLRRISGQVNTIGHTFVLA